jgi:hypothetical protein
MNSPALLLLVGTALADRGELDDYEPLPRYLSAPRVEQGLREGLGAVGACLQSSQRPAPSLAVDAEIAIGPDGAILGVRTALDPEEPSLQRCVEQALCSLSFPSHDESFERWSFHLAASQGEVYLLPGLSPVARPRSPLFVSLPSTADAQLEGLLADAFGPSWSALYAQTTLSACEPGEPPPRPVQAQDQDMR